MKLTLTLLLTLASIPALARTMTRKEKPRPSLSAALSSGDLADLGVEVSNVLLGIVLTPCVHKALVSLPIILPGADCVELYGILFIHVDNAAQHRCLALDKEPLGWRHLKDGNFVARFVAMAHSTLLIFKQPVARLIATNNNIIAHFKSRFFAAIKHQWVSGSFAPQSLKKINSKHAFCLIAGLLVSSPALARHARPCAPLLITNAAGKSIILSDDRCSRGHSFVLDGVPIRPMKRSR